jgi:hypothetical protein
MKIPLAISLVIGLISCDSSDSSRLKNTASQNESHPKIDSIQHENKSRIEKKYGSQWDFCDCVKKSDSIDKVLKKSALSEAETTKLLLRADEVEKKCKLFLTDLQSKKPADRAAHQAKVKACLNNQE